jgi:DNA-binding NarL/FixJ family response regulator
MQGNQIRLVLVDEQTLLRESLGRLLSTQPDLLVVGECATASESLEILNGSSVDIVLFDLSLRAEQGDGLISACRSAGYEGRFLTIAGAMNAEELAAALKLGVSGVFLKSEPPDRLVQAIRLVATGAVWVDQRLIQLLAEQLADRPRQDSQRSGGILTDREERVLVGILGGLTNRKIGDHLSLSESSVKSVVQQLFFRAGVRTRSQLVRKALEGSLGSVRDLGKLLPDAMPALTPTVFLGTQTANRL